MPPWERLTVVQGRLRADLLKSYLEAHGVEATLFQEGVGHWAYPVTINGLGRVEVFVPSRKLARAKKLLRIFSEEEEQQCQGGES